MRSECDPAKCNDAVPAWRSNELNATITHPEKPLNLRVLFQGVGFSQKCVDECLFIGSGLEKLKFAAHFFCLSLMLINEP
jgi:hypothetical protein